MDANLTAPEPAATPPAPGCPHCGAGGDAADPMAVHCALLTELNHLGMEMARALAQQARESDHKDPRAVLGFEIVARIMRRNAALVMRILEERSKTPAQRAADLVRREEAAERARLRDRREQVRQGVAAVIRSEGAPPDRESLLSDLNERLLHPRFDMALTHQDASALILDTCKSMKLVPQDETWSDALIMAEAGARRAELQRATAERAARPAESGWEEAARADNAAEGERKIGRFTFGPSGDVIAEDPPDPPQSAWPPDVLGGRKLPDLLGGRSDSG